MMIISLNKKIVWASEFELCLCVAGTFSVSQRAGSRTDLLRHLNWSIVQIHSPRIDNEWFSLFHRPVF
jgi:hypothetical protein